MNFFILFETLPSPLFQIMSSILQWTLWDDPSPGLAATIHVPVTEELHGWGVSFVFNKEFTNLNFFNGLTEVVGSILKYFLSSDLVLQVNTGHSFNVTNESWSGNKHPGDTIAFSMLGDYEQGGAEEIIITDIALNGLVLCTN